MEPTEEERQEFRKLMNGMVDQLRAEGMPLGIARMIVLTMAQAVIEEGKQNKAQTHDGIEELIESTRTKRMN